jgi:hypothetical protein
MREFSMTIAGRTALVRPLFESTEHYCGRYPAEGTPDFEICVTPQDLAFEQEELDREAAEEGFRFRKFTEPFLERTAIARAFAEDVAAGKRQSQELTEELLSTYLYSRDIPDPELIIRPSGEKRTSNFLLWQSAYSEYVFMNVLWPDFAPEHLDEAIEEYHRRNRRFGGT